MTGEGKKDIKLSTKRKYEQIINILKDKTHNEIENYLSDKKPSTKKLFLSTILYDKNNDKLLKYDMSSLHIQKNIKNIFVDIQKENDKNLLKDNEKDKFLQWLNVLKTRDDIINVKGNIEEKVICGIYTYQPPRRLLDYVEMYYHKTQPNINELDSNKNYLIMLEKPFFIFNNYKTSDSMGVHTIQIFSPKLITFLKQYIKEHKIQHTEKLLKYANSNKLSRKLQRLFNKYAKKELSVNILRHSYISHMQKTDQLDTLEQRKRLSYLMGHSVMTQLEYHRTDQN